MEIGSNTASVNRSFSGAKRSDLVLVVWAVNTARIQQLVSLNWLLGCDVEGS